MVQREYLTQGMKEEAERNLVNYTSDFQTNPNQARAEAQAEQQQIQNAQRRGERSEIVDAMRYGAKKSLTARENARITAENERRQREYQAAVAAERARYEREMAAYRAAVNAYNEQQYPSSSTGGGGGRRPNSSGGIFGAFGNAFRDVFGW